MEALAQHVIGIHPLVIASTCDHYTRVSTNGSKLPADAPVCGLIFGTRGQSHVSICDSVDINYTFSNDDVDILPGEIESKTKLWTAVFTSYKPLGWYTFGSKLLPLHKKIHAKIAKVVENPLLLFINTTADSDSDVLPLNIFANENGNTSFVNVPLKIETSEVEKIAVDHITKSTPMTGLSSLEVQNQSLLTSMRILGKHVDSAIDALQSMKQGTRPVNHAMLRSAAKICNSLPPIDSSDFEKSFYEDMTNSMLMSYLSTVNKTTGQLDNVATLFSSTYQEKGAQKA